MFKQVRRVGKVPTDQAARDAENRSKLQAEFPPLEPASSTPILSEPLREAIIRSRKSIRRLATEAKVSQVVLEQFMSGQRDLRLATAERLASLLGLRLVAV
jgi:hypothetical protein